MAGSITEFKSSFGNDLARPSRFDVNIPIPIVLLPFRNTARQLSLRCETAQLPSRTFSTAEQRFGSNPVEKYPYHTEYNDLELTFLVSDDMSEKLFFDSWLELINPSYTFNFKYKGDYAVNMQVNQYDVTNNKSYSINLNDAYPISMNQLDLDWSNTEYHKLTVVFAYTYWQNNSLQSIGSSLLQSALSKITAGIAELGLPRDANVENILPQIVTNTQASTLALAQDIGNAENASAIADSQYGTPLAQNANLDKFVE